ncbi:MAG: hypothetical protein DI586_04980 [Micavibrio aeruginosavorus]|uniref:Poly A polymerase head domain-containing protein n=1 Tax=Micavibrio aeruginosavorus TaxID=349221 RepID=A0A2W5HD14_9BACT|nr:MAG: hypothetical protein DI586_04980 [Micavibrio aeruginosavorus]
MTYAPVPLKMMPPESGIELLNLLQDAGFDNPVLFGGCLRDSFRKAAFNDLDIRVGVAPAFHGASVIESAKTYLDDIPEVEILRMPRERGGYGYKKRSNDGFGVTEFRFRTLFNFKGYGIPADIVAMESIPNIDDIVMDADAPINGIALKLGEPVMAHPYFEEDIASATYAILRTDPRDIADSVKRFQAIAPRFPGLKIVMNKDLT